MLIVDYSNFPTVLHILKIVFRFLDIEYVCEGIIYVQSRGHIGDDFDLKEIEVDLKIISIAFSSAYKVLSMYHLV